MEKVISYDELNLDIELIEEIKGSNREFEIYFSNSVNNKFKLQFNNVFDIRYSVENGFIDRVSKMPVDILRNNRIFMLKNSSYFNNFTYQISGTIPTDNIKHFLLFDRVDTGIELLTTSDPILTKL
ncbi:hypothetical protein ACFSKI_07215 [Pseudogracilibacillus auburnensis]|uniref:Uncharacterized protein n=1 Tax=Pseudogracilibacillus auburnensis TaxID=1494959 RepID=A0A2V3VU56_9BACI|nr:hypothetical protein [Pseudogracilibacillus auburnensis]PXW83545.1 hypothetical protein DFR56_11513 [Pseudogracilibacillus auburnensis]